jgi:hypothetical protein
MSSQQLRYNSKKTKPMRAEFRLLLQVFCTFELPDQCEDMFNDRYIHHAFPSIVLFPLDFNSPSNPLPKSSFSSLSLTIMTNNFNIHSTNRIKHKRRIILRMIILSQPRRTITSGTSLQRRSMELLHLLCICFQHLSATICLGSHLIMDFQNHTYSRPETQHATPSILS